MASNQWHIDFIYFLQTVILADFAIGNFVGELPIKKGTRRLQIAQADGRASIHITNHVMHFRQILMQRLKLVGGEWNLADLEGNMKSNDNFCCPPLQF